MTPYHDRFRWDARKDKANREKHQVSFQTAAEVLADDRADVFHLEYPDEDHSTQEDRSITIGSHPDDRRLVLLVVWTRRSGTTRIISARKANTRERARHAEKVRQAHGL